MPDEIIKELWQIKEDIAREHGYDINSLVTYLQIKRRHENQRVVDLRSLKETAEAQILSK